LFIFPEWNLDAPRTVNDAWPTQAVQARPRVKTTVPELAQKGRCLTFSGHARAKEERIFMAFSTAGGGPSRPEMNVTPLIDILLVLIIVFMVIVATSKEYVVNYPTS